MKIGDLVKHRCGQVGTILSRSREYGWKVLWITGMTPHTSFTKSRNMEVISA